MVHITTEMRRLVAAKMDRDIQLKWYLELFDGLFFRKILKVCDTRILSRLGNEYEPSVLSLLSAYLYSNYSAVKDAAARILALAIPTTMDGTDREVKFLRGMLELLTNIILSVAEDVSFSSAKK